MAPEGISRLLRQFIDDMSRRPLSRPVVINQSRTRDMSTPEADMFLGQSLSANNKAARQAR